MGTLDSNIKTSSISCTLFEICLKKSTFVHISNFLFSYILS